MRVLNALASSRVMARRAEFSATVSHTPVRKEKGTWGGEGGEDK